MIATLKGTAAREKDALIFTAGSGAKIALKNRDKKGDEKVEDVVAKIDGWLKDKKNTVKISGQLTEDDKGNLTLALSSADYVEPKK